MKLENMTIDEIVYRKNINKNKMKGCPLERFIKTRCRIKDKEEEYEGHKIIKRDEYKVKERTQKMTNNRNEGEGTVKFVKRLPDGSVKLVEVEL